jgi:hypothetical protein
MENHQSSWHPDGLTMPSIHVATASIGPFVYRVNQRIAYTVNMSLPLLLCFMD